MVFDTGCTLELLGGRGVKIADAQVPASGVFIWSREELRHGCFLKAPQVILLFRTSDSKWALRFLLLLRVWLLKIALPASTERVN